jgi:3',5'-cyclic AMP phosphodiesterase CpdA
VQPTLKRFVTDIMKKRLSLKLPDVLIAGIHDVWLHVL